MHILIIVIPYDYTSLLCYITSAIIIIILCPAGAVTILESLIGMGAASVLMLTIVSAGVICCWRRHKRNRKRPETPNPRTPSQNYSVGSASRKEHSISTQQSASGSSGKSIASSVRTVKATASKSRSSHRRAHRTKRGRNR